MSVRKLVAVGIESDCVHVAREHRGAALHQLAARCSLAVGGLRRARRRRGPVAAGGAEHVGLDDPPRRPAAGDLCEIDALGGRRAGRDRGDAHPVGDRAPGRSARRRRRQASRSAADPSGGLVLQGDPRDDLSDRDRVALLHEQLAHDAAGGRGQLDVDLVGRDLDDRVVALDEVARLDSPFEDRSLGDRLARGGGDDVDCLPSRRACRHLNSL